MNEAFHLSLGGNFDKVVSNARAVTLIIILSKERKENEGFQRLWSSSALQWQLNVTLICCLPLAQLTPFFHSQIIINLQILTPAWCLILHPNSDISNVGKQYLGCDVLD